MSTTPHTWTPEQIEALKESIAHYERATKDRGEILGANTCACCKRWFTNWSNRCQGCPIYAVTGCTGCNETPYYVEKYDYNELAEIQDNKDIPDDVFFSLVQKELDFLKYVLAQGTPKT